MNKKLESLEAVYIYIYREFKKINLCKHRKNYVFLGITKVHSFLYLQLFMGTKLKLYIKM